MRARDVSTIRRTRHRSEAESAPNRKALSPGLRGLLAKPPLRCLLQEPLDIPPAGGAADYFAEFSSGPLKAGLLGR